MGKKKEAKVKEFKPGDPLPGPDPSPKEGDKVNYIFNEHVDTKLQGKAHPATVTHVHEGHDGRLVNVIVELADGPQRIGPTPFREPDPESGLAGNTWHWPDEPDEAA